MIKAARVVIIIASVTLALTTKSGIFFAIPLVFECAYKFHLGYNHD